MVVMPVDVALKRIDPCEQRRNSQAHGIWCRRAVLLRPRIHDRWGAVRNDLPRDAHDDRVVVDGTDQNRVRPDARVVAHPDRPEDLGPGANGHPVANGRMPLAVLQAGAPQGHAVVDRHVAADLGRLADDDAGTVVDEDPGADGGARVDLDAGEEARELGDGARGQIGPVRPQRMRDPMRPDGMDSGVEQRDLELRSSGRVPLYDRLEVMLHRP